MKTIPENPQPGQRYAGEDYFTGKWTVWAKGKFADKFLANGLTITDARLLVFGREAVAALRPFAAYVNCRGSDMPNSTLMDCVISDGPTLGDCRKVAAALAHFEEGAPDA